MEGCIMECVICNEKITADPFGWEDGCNAEPVASGICCYRCDINVVLTARLIQQGIDRRDVDGIVAEIWLEVAKKDREVYKMKGAE